jgi:hypothetical protein
MDTYDWDFYQPNRRTNQMLSQLSLMGNVTLNAHDIKIGYGIGAPPSGSKSPNSHIEPDDLEVTDIEKATWAHTSPAKRTFYGFGDGDDEAVRACIQENLNDYILENPYGRPG